MLSVLELHLSYVGATVGQETAPRPHPCCRERSGLCRSALSSFLMISKLSQSWYVGSSAKSQTSGESSFSFCTGNQWTEVSLKVSRYRG